jgi:hypothetical protein
MAAAPSNKELRNNAWRRVIVGLMTRNLLNAKGIRAHIAALCLKVSTGIGIRSTELLKGLVII